MFETTKWMWADIKIQQQGVIKRLESLEKRTSSLIFDDLDLIKTVEVNKFNKNLKNKENEIIFITIPVEAELSKFPEFSFEILSDHPLGWEQDFHWHL